ncbi:uncharacterized protein K452DRAFT_295142 [Aplosporella prunicola CBS 121167]|uniref:Zn(2)-C6 fungal-type domain-containing protein n=1 Tax=Aplosporella prunicola CBS 121167 TaxID=1176127 RepID=A0A6A6BSG4_9PEZI|nr:uncharacterized protein K452DRAFT_295142 [Aplosporella prunicola CBS 121167]KAF2145521.1 hypothetical protein K452DRAFT_295142 [Aplosporella prunicola CBS 121167]
MAFPSYYNNGTGEIQKDPDHAGNRLLLASAPLAAYANQQLPDSTFAQRSKPPQTKRNHITPVACTPCQHRKHKCDGRRPVCSSCIAKKRPDCVYDAAGDQRRTSALKLRIKDLERQNADLKDIVAGIGLAPDRDQAISIAQHLAESEFHGTGDVAEYLRRNSDGAVGASKRLKKDSHSFPTSAGVMAPPVSLMAPSTTIDGVVPPAWEPELPSASMNFTPWNFGQSSGEVADDWLQYPFGAPSPMGQRHIPDNFYTPQGAVEMDQESGSSQ